VAGATLAEVMAALGRPAGEVPNHPVIHGPRGTLVSFGLPDAKGVVHYTGVWLVDDAPTFLDPSPEPGASRAHRLTGPSAQLFDLYIHASRVFLERVEELDERLAETQQRGRTVPLNEIWSLSRHVASLRAQLGRSLVGMAELTGHYAAVFPGFSNAMPAASAELLRVQELAAGVQQSLSDLILLRNAEEANRIAEAANQLARTSNRIAALANTSNIRMLGLTYIGLVLALVSAVVLIPNTGATILGMPSAGWVPGWWVVAVLILLGVLPLLLIFSRPWVGAILRDLRESEGRAREGMDDLPELASDGSKPGLAVAQVPSGKRL
jgi:hypothetical protein